MIWNTLQNGITASMMISGDSYRALNTNQFKNIFYLITTVCILFLAQTKIVIAAESIYDEPQDLKTGTINRNFIDDVGKRTKNINGVKYEIMEVRDQINAIIANPVSIDEHVLTENAEVIDTSEDVTPIIPAVQKKEVLITRYSKPKIETINNKQTVDKPILIQSITLLPTKKTPANITDNNIATVAKNKPVYNKHDIDGTLLGHGTEKWSCIHDTKNNLMWEVKSNSNDLRNSNNLYSWFKAENQTTSGIADGGRCQGDSDCDTNAYVQAMNKQNFCGHNDWQLPTREQMQTLVYLKNDAKSAKINKDYFPKTVPSWYWTASEHNDNNNFAWYVLFRNGVSLSDLKERPKHIRLVREVSLSALNESQKHIHIVQNGNQQ